MAAGVRWVHFSDIHVGMRDQPWLWPRFESQLLKDLEVAYAKTGGLDVVIFSGDLTQQALPEEFNRFEEIIGRVLDKIETLGGRPQIVTVTGNHDLRRPDAVAPLSIAMAQYWQRPELRERFWNEEDDTYRSFIREVFSSYTEWRERAIQRGVHVKASSIGLLPADASYIIDTSAGRLGLVCLNSSWLQLGAANYTGDLHLDTRQILAVTGGHPDDWVQQNRFNLIVTHHPPEWLHRDSLAFWNDDINPAGRFDLHLFGHMHAPSTWSISHGGGHSRRSVQAPSLFGLEVFGDGTEKRIQGYSANEIRADASGRTFVSWPRRLVDVAGGGRKLAPDTSQNLQEDNSFSLNYQVERQAVAPAELVNAKTSLPLERALKKVQAFDLSLLKHNIAEAKAHQKVRRIEQQSCINALDEKRAVWIASDWGMGEDGFIAAIRKHFRVPNDTVYRLELNDYVNRQSFLEDVRSRFGASFEHICECIADAGPSILILDDVNVVAAANLAITTLEIDIEALAETVSDFSPETLIFIRSRRAPRSAKLSCVELKALDEADVAIYARESEIGGDRYAKPDAVGALYRHTDGIPTRIDAALRDLEIVSLGDLVASNPDFGDAGGLTVPAPPALVSTVAELEQSADRAERRAYDLLQALSTLPQGEQLSRIRRFLGPHAFHPSHARALLERCLIDTVARPGFDEPQDDPIIKALVVPRPVREYVRESLDEETRRALDRKALNLYFGQDWATESIKSSPTGKRVRSPLCAEYEITNASTLILRAARRAFAKGETREIAVAIRLAVAFILCLMEGNHYRSVVSLSRDVIGTIEGFGGYDRQVNMLRYELARGLRMTSKHAEAREEFAGLDHTTLTKAQRQSAELGLALCFESSGDLLTAADTAKRVIAIDKSSTSALHAKAIIAAQIQEQSARHAELRRLLDLARRRKAHVLVNNILLTLARDKKNSDHQSSETLLREIISTVKAHSDFYNAARAIVDLASRPNAAKTLTENERERLLEAYHFLYSERLGNLFDRCHEALWKLFDADGDSANLLNLFRHSSFIWRLNWHEAKETEYLRKLIKRVHSLLLQDVRRATRDGAYFVVRVAAVLGEPKSISIR